MPTYRAMQYSLLRLTNVWQQGARLGHRGRCFRTRAVHENDRLTARTFNEKPRLECDGAAEQNIDDDFDATEIRRGSSTKCDDMWCLVITCICTLSVRATSVSRLLHEQPIDELIALIPAINRLLGRIIGDHIVHLKGISE